VLASERRVEQARATLDGVRDTLKKTTVVSPMDRIVTARRVEEGEVAVIGVLNQPGTVLLTISDMSVVEAEMEVDETSIPTVEVGQAARVRIDVYPNRSFDGVGVGLGVALLARVLFDFQAAAPLWAVLLGFGVSTAVGIVFGLWPALQAARQDPIEALRYE